MATLHIVPAAAGNAIGVLVGGAVIGRSEKPSSLSSSSLLMTHHVSRTKRYKVMAIFTGLVDITSFVTILLRWRGPISAWKSLYIFPAGFAVVLLNASQLIALGAAVETKHMAQAIGLFTLSQRLGMLLDCTHTQSF